MFNKQPFGGSIATFINCFPQMKHNEIEQLKFLPKYHLLINSFHQQDGLFGIPYYSSVVKWFQTFQFIVIILSELSLGLGLESSSHRKSH